MTHFRESTVRAIGGWWRVSAAIAVVLPFTSPLLHGQLTSEPPHRHAGRQVGDAEPAREESAGAAGPGYFGFIVDHRAGPDGGVEVLRVHPAGPADRAGLRTGDRIDAIDGYPIRTIVDLEQIVRASRSGDQLQLSVTRNGASSDMAMTLGNRPIESQRLNPRFGKIPAPAERPGIDTKASGARRPAPLGLQLAPLTEAVRRRLNVPGAGGVLVNSVRDRSSADQAGISAGSVLLSIDGHPLRSLDQAKRSLANVGERQSVAVIFFQQGELMRTELQSMGEEVEPAGADKRGKPTKDASTDPPRTSNDPSPDRWPAMVEGLQARIESLERRIETLERREGDARRKR